MYVYINKFCKFKKIYLVWLLFRKIRPKRVDISDDVMCHTTLKNSVTLSKIYKIILESTI